MGGKANMITLEKMLKLEMNELIDDGDLCVRRVPGGFLYHEVGGICFVPYETKKQPLKKKKKEATKDQQTYLDLIWNAYPARKRKAKASVLDAIIKLNPDWDLVQKIVTAIGAAAVSQDWKKDGGQYIPLLTTYLNQQRWLDGVFKESEIVDSWSA